MGNSWPPRVLAAAMRPALRADQRPDRRIVLALLGAIACAPTALSQTGPAASRLSLPLRLAYARVTPDGLASPSGADQEAFRALKLRLGALIHAIEPLPSGRLFDLSPPASDGGAACILTARQMAEAAGHDRLLLYATDDGRRDYGRGRNWLSQAFASLRSSYGPYDAATGEAHLFDVAGGSPLLSVSSDARPKIAANPFDFRHPESEAFDSLLGALELRLRALAYDWFDGERSIAD